MEDANNSNAPRRKRSMTEVTLGWLAERIRKAERIKEAVSNGTFNVDSEQVARSILNNEEK